jgi:hypothetical protein
MTITTTTTTNPYPDVPLPAGAIPASDWGDHASALPLWYRACKTATSRAKQVSELRVHACRPPLQDSRHGTQERGGYTLCIIGLRSHDETAITANRR